MCVWAIDEKLMSCFDGLSQLANATGSHNWSINYFNKGYMHLMNRGDCICDDEKTIIPLLVCAGL